MVDGKRSVGRERDEATGLVAQLRDIHHRLRWGRVLSHSQRRLLLDSLEEFFETLEDGGSPSLDRSLGLKAWGGISAAREDALSRRDELIRRLWHSHPEWRDQQPSAAARLMHIEAERYEQHRWPREQHLITAPPAEPAATWWRILRDGLAIPGTKRLQQILRAEIQVRI